MDKGKQKELIQLLDNCIIKPSMKDHLKILWWSIFNHKKVEALYIALKEGRHFRAAMNKARAGL